MTNISATKLVKSIKDNTLSLIQFRGDLDNLQPVKYLDNPGPEDIQKAFLFNGINYADYNWTYDAEGAQMRRRNGVTLATSHFMPTYGVHITNGKTLAASPHANLFNFLSVNGYDQIDNHLKQVDNACAGVMSTFLPLLSPDEGAACHNAAWSILHDIKRTQSYLINRRIALTVSQYLLTALRLDLKALAGYRFTPYLADHLFNRASGEIGVLCNLYDKHDINVLVDMERLAVQVWVRCEDYSTDAEAIELISFPECAFNACANSPCASSSNRKLTEPRHTLREQENHIKSELEKVEAALTSAKSERYLRSLLTEWLDAHNHYQAVHQRLHILMSSHSSYLVNSETNPVHPVLDTSSLR
jgi:hypothetical protein